VATEPAKVLSAARNMIEAQEHHADLVEKAKDPQ